MKSNPKTWNAGCYFVLSYQRFTDTAHWIFKAMSGHLSPACHSLLPVLCVRRSNRSSSFCGHPTSLAPPLPLFSLKPLISHLILSRSLCLKKRTWEKTKFYHNYDSHETMLNLRRTASSDVRVRTYSHFWLGCSVWLWTILSILPLSPCLCPDFTVTCWGQALTFFYFSTGPNTVWNF